MAGERKQARVAIWDSDIELFDRLAEDWQMTDTELATKILSAGLRAIQENGMVAGLPLRFQIAASFGRNASAPALSNDEESDITEPRKRAGARRS